MIYDPDNQLGKLPGTLEIIRLTTHETEAVILESALLMTEKEQSVFYKLREGCTMKEAGEAVGVGRERARQLISHGCRTIRIELGRRYNRAISEKRLCIRSCGFFALGEASCESLTRFKCIMDFLTPSYLVTDTYVERSYVSSGFLFVMKNMRIPVLHPKPDAGMHITALMSKCSLPEEHDDIDAVRALFCPPCHAVGYVGRADAEGDADDFSVIADMIERMDFCICNLSTTPYGEKIREYAAQTGRTVLLDIGK
jgi:Sigma-70, region 4.